MRQIFLQVQAGAGRWNWSGLALSNHAYKSFLTYPNSSSCYRAFSPEFGRYSEDWAHLTITYQRLWRLESLGNNSAVMQRRLPRSPTDRPWHARCLSELSERLFLTWKQWIEWNIRNTKYRCLLYYYYCDTDRKGYEGLASGVLTQELDEFEVSES